MEQPFVTAIAALVGAIIGGVFTTVIAPKVAEKYELRRIYLAPFRKWCADFYGELDEFWTRYFSRKITRTYYSNVQIIDDWRALHEAAEDGLKWLAKVKREEEKKEDEKIAKKFNNLLDVIDRLWHEAEENYNVRLKDRFDIISLGRILRENMANDLWDAKADVLREVSSEDKEAILNYLKERIP